MAEKLTEQVEVAKEYWLRQKHQPMCGCDHEQNDPWCPVGASKILLAALSEVQAERDSAIRGVCYECNAEPVTRCAKCFHEAENRAHKAEAALAKWEKRAIAYSQELATERAQREAMRGALEKLLKRVEEPWLLTTRLVEMITQMSDQLNDASRDGHAALAAQPPAPLGTERSVPSKEWIAGNLADYKACRSHREVAAIESMFAQFIAPPPAPHAGEENTHPLKGEADGSDR